MNEIAPNAAPETVAVEADTRAVRIERLLRTSLAPTLLQLRDESHLHAGHRHHEERGDHETHFRLTIASDAFSGLSRVAGQRLVNNALAGEFETGLHALAIKIVDTVRK